MANTHGKNVSIIGAGAVGSALGIALSKSGYKVRSVISSSRAAAGKLSKKIGCKLSSTSVEHLHTKTDLLLIAVPDREIGAVVREVSAHSSLRWKGLNVFHTSGLLTSDLLEPLGKKGAQIFSLHPIQSFPAKGTGSVNGISFGFEGNARAARAAKKIVGDVKGEFLNVPKEAKVLYHCACVIASNYPVVLLNIVDELARRTLKPRSLHHFRALTETSIRNAFETGPINALTGPIARGDAQTVKAHLQALLDTDKNIVGLYRALGSAAVRMVRTKNIISPKQLDELTLLLSTEYEHLTF